MDKTFFNLYLSCECYISVTIDQVIKTFEKFMSKSCVSHLYVSSLATANEAKIQKDKGCNNLTACELHLGVPEW